MLYHDYMYLVQTENGKWENKDDKECPAGMLIFQPWGDKKKGIFTDLGTNSGWVSGDLFSLFISWCFTKVPLEALSDPDSLWWPSRRVSDPCTGRPERQKPKDSEYAECGHSAFSTKTRPSPSPQPDCRVWPGLAQVWGSHGAEIPPPVSLVPSVSFWPVIMRVLAVCSLLVLFIGLGYSFRITELLKPFNEGRQDDSGVGDQILPVFAAAFFATAINSILGSIQPGMDTFWTEA